MRHASCGCVCVCVCVGECVSGYESSLHTCDNTKVGVTTRNQKFRILSNSFLAHSLTHMCSRLRAHVRKCDLASSAAAARSARHLRSSAPKTQGHQFLPAHTHARTHTHTSQYMSNAVFIMICVGVEEQGRGLISHATKEIAHSGRRCCVVQFV